MAKANPKRVWHLSRRDEPPCVISDKELLLLAELGHLRADDLLWGPDFEGYRPVRSLLGDTRARKQIRVETPPPSLGAVETTELYTMPTTSLGRTKRRISLLGVAGVLVVVALVGALGLVIHRYLTADPQRATQNTASTEPASAPTPPSASSAPSATAAIPVAQPTSEPATANTASPSAATGPVEPEQAAGQDKVIVRTVKLVDIDPPQTPKALPSAANPAPEDSSSSSAVPSPNKKHANPVQSLSTAGQERASSAASGRVSETPRPTPMGLGPFGFSSQN